MKTSELKDRINAFIACHGDCEIDIEILDIDTLEDGYYTNGEKVCNLNITKIL